MADIDLIDGERICRSLNKGTLERLTKAGIDRRIIKPIIDEAIRLNTCDKLTYEKINLLLDNQNFYIMAYFQILQ
ncbi:hypothetical protein [Clostridium sp. E02]|uniref:hypothetical protein n=1 Tax=Clostridium sp. E02 TaxID=2487134 RepID=UPI000F51EDBB|nr:hypothetical protein [Clostridium sp. E02]